MGEEAGGDLVGFLRFLVGRGAGDEHQAVRSRLVGALHVEGRRGPGALEARDHAGLARVEEPDAHVGGRVLQFLAQLGERQARIPQAQLAFLRVAGEIDEQQRGLAPVAGRLRAALQLAQGAAHVVRLRAGQEPRIAFLHAAQAGEDAVDAPGVALGVAQGPRPRSALRVPHHQGEAVHVGARRAGCQKQRERQGMLHGPRSNDTSTTSAPLGAPFLPSRRTASPSMALSANTARSVARRAGPVHSKASGSSRKAGPL